MNEKLFLILLPANDLEINFANGGRTRFREMALPLIYSFKQNICLSKDVRNKLT